MRQTPLPGQHLLRFCGDALTVDLRLETECEGRAFLRTNIGHAKTERAETIAEVQQRRSRLGWAWYDLPMQRIDARTFRITLALTEVGHFEGKAFFLPADSDTPHWPEGPNTVVNVEPASYCCGNSIYNAFVRQFGVNKATRQLPGETAGIVSQLDRRNYTVIPPSGTFRDLKAELDLIIDRLGCRIIQLLPIHPIPSVYARMGRYGSPYAALDFTGIDPSLAEFDRKATPLNQFLELVDAIHGKGAKLFLDIAINHCGWGAKLHETHPEWLLRDKDGSIHSPGAWGVTWEDLTELDHSRRDLWQYLGDMFITWCERGVDGFRCDAGYMIPLSAWAYIVARVRQQFPDAVFLLEGLGGAVEVTEQLLNEGNFNWAYSELFQNYSREQIEDYLPRASAISESRGVMVHFAETHDNPRLAGRSPAYARMRTALAALCSSCGAFGFANGVEWYATEKIDVHDACSLNWGASENQVDHIARLNALLITHEAFRPTARTRQVQTGPGNSLAVLRTPVEGAQLIALINLSDTTVEPVAWPRDLFAGVSTFTDLLSEESIRPDRAESLARLTLAPAQVLCLSGNPRDLAALQTTLDAPGEPPSPVTVQRWRAVALSLLRHLGHSADVTGLDIAGLAAELAENPALFCRRHRTGPAVPRLVHWQWPRDTRREVMLPPDQVLLLSAEVPFRVQVRDDNRVLRQKDAMVRPDGSMAVLLFGFESPTDTAKRLFLRVAAFERGDVASRTDSTLLLLPSDPPRFQPRVDHEVLLQDRGTVLDTNGRGGMLHAGTVFADLQSKYDALLAANLDPSVPVDRHIMLARCRGWIVFQAYSAEIDLRCLQHCLVLTRGVRWNFRVPTGLGTSIELQVTAAMIPGENAVEFTVERPSGADESLCLPDDSAVQLIVRPDLEDRNYHHVTKAYTGPENDWPDSIDVEAHGFTFRPVPGRAFAMTTSTGSFTKEPEWQYCVHHPLEEERGMDFLSDLFSPGFFAASLRGNERVTFTAHAAGDRSALRPNTAARRVKAQELTDSDCTLEQTLHRALTHYVVKRDEGKTVIAGYPWFLDWGRDTLICARGLIAAGFIDEVEEILCQFAAFEDRGTLPNMIRGADARDRDTSDAPLWLFVACRDLMNARGHHALLERKVGGRTVADVLVSIAKHYVRGTPNGIKVDDETGLVFSPSHFTWMDTNYPAGTPREGYPVEVQALWHAALELLGDVTADEHWGQEARRVRHSLLKYFWRGDAGYFADCLHCTPGGSAADADADDALRPNQLLCITLQAVREKDSCRRVLESCAELLVPGAIRSLADRRLSAPLTIKHDGILLNDPRRPYRGTYQGDEDTHRKPAYHNGTAWTWLFPSYPEAYYMTHGEDGVSIARSLLHSCAVLLNTGCRGHIPEITDGDFPHTPRGCDAQAWGATEFYRVLTLPGLRGAATRAADSGKNWTPLT